MSTKTLFYPYTLLTMLCLCLTFGANAQLQASFTMDKPGGCSPLSVQFTNTTTGGSATTTYQWTFGNGNSSAKKDPGASYYDEKTYTVTLTAKDGATTNTKTQQVTVYKKPAVDFGVSPAKGCVPLATTFTANATAGDGTISKYYWDFGDGGVEEGTNQTASHTYTFPQKPPTSLTVTNSYGCYTTSTKNGLVEAVKGVVASFTPSPSALCKAGDEVTFTNTSTGSGTLTYIWDFGDGKTSTAQSPKHIFTAKGTYTVKLNVKSSDGCNADATPFVMNVANFTADFETQPLICLYDNVGFFSKSTQGFTSLTWKIDNLDYGYGNDYFFNTFYTAGKYDITLDATYGSCAVSITKNVTVNPKPGLSKFLVDLKGACGAPVTIDFSDTTKDAVKWNWTLVWQNDISFGNTKTVSHTFATGGVEQIALEVTNKEGCSTRVSDYVYYDKPGVSIYEKSFNQLNNSCVGATFEFATWQDSILQDFKWDFGDGGTSTERFPVHQFNKGGQYTVNLEFTTKSGCKGTSKYEYINVIELPKFDFSVDGGTTICGNTPTIFRASPAGWPTIWSFNDTTVYDYYFTSTITRKFEYDTTYTVMMISVKDNCRDTITKTNYIKVLPPFPKIKDVINTCEGQRDNIRFTESSYKALTWNWDFGDGKSESYSTVKDTIRHTYPTTGAYKVVLTTTNGQCTVKDSVNAFIMLKQKPVLSSPRNEACASDVVDWQLKGYERNSWTEFLTANIDFEKIDYQYNDLTTDADLFIGGTWYWQKETEGTIRYLQSGKTGIRFITTTVFFNCQDTTNFIPLRIHGPVAGYIIEPHSGCFKDPVVFTDTSHAYPGTPITTWQWLLKENLSFTRNTGGGFSYTFDAPTEFYPALIVTDADGCTDLGTTYQQVKLGGPKADFTASSYNVAPNTLVSFYNASLEYGYYYSSQLKWIFPDGSTSTQEDGNTYLFTDEGKYDVTLITYNTQTGCTDTIVKTITVRKVNSAFTYSLSYINNNSCPPVMARFNSISANAVRLGWDFGDGGTGGDQQIVSHTYNAAGLYRVVHYSYDANNAVDSTEDFIEIKGPYALLKADTLYACNTLQVKLSAEVKYAKDYTWDFGDGTLVAGTDTFATHDYLTPGIYIPALILKDEGGCSTTSQLPEKIIVDSLSAEFSTVPAAVCNAATVVFTPQTSSLSADNLQTVLQYRWVISEGNVNDTLDDQFTSRNFSMVGEHNIALRVTSPYGCVANAMGKVDVKPGVTASIAGPLQICKNAPTTFTGNATPASNTLQWTWNFGNTTSNVQNPAAQVFTSAGQQAISLIVSNGNCADTANFMLSVQEAPVITITPAQPILCLGDSINLTVTAATGTTFQWSPATFIQNANTATATVWPAANKFYKVKVSNAAGCASTDSVEVKVIAPFQLTAKSPLFACAGNTVQLNAAGADKYIWQNGTGLSNANIANPIATTATSASYTVVGFDNYNCFTDTAIVAVKIGKLPTVNAGTDYQIIAGSKVKIATISSADVTKWEWNPADYLTCATCPSPTSTPKASTVYELTVYTAEGCFAKDTVRMELICKSELVYIPTGFTPNGDNLNDRFAIHGSGIKSIRHLVVFDRWGKAVFERKNANINDRNSSWDGKYNSEPAPSAAYIYMVEVECDGGDVFTYKGTVTLVR